MAISLQMPCMYCRIEIIKTKTQIVKKIIKTTTICLKFVLHETQNKKT